MQTLCEIYPALESLGVQPVLADGLAVCYWGYPRSTQDIDLAVLVSDRKRFEVELRGMGLSPTKPRHSVDVGFVQVSQWINNVEDAYIDVEVDFLMSESEYHRQTIVRAEFSMIAGLEFPIRILTCEDLLIFKAAAGRMIDRADIRILMEQNRLNLDTSYLNDWIEILNLRGVFDSL
jgi:hypothetical protein